MLDNIFEKLNLKKVHTEIYLNLLESGPIPAGKLAKRLNIARSTLYGFLNDLGQKGLVKESEKYGVKIWQAAPPEKINDTINDQINNMETVKAAFANLLPELKKQQKTDFVSPKFTYYEGVEGVKHMLKDVLLYRDLITESFWPFKDMIEVLGADFLRENNNIKRIKQNITLNVIWPRNKAIDITQYPFMGVGKDFMREIRIAPAGVESSMGYWAYANKVAFISSKKESFGFIVESLELRQLLKTQFDVLWKISKPIHATAKSHRKFLEENNLI